MNQSDQARFAALLTDVLAFYGQAVSGFALSVWWEACRSFEYEAVQRALSRHAMDPERGMFAPKPADVVRQVQGTPTDRAARAWSITLDAASRVGAYTDVVFDDPIIHACIEDMGGWVALCRTDTERLSYLQHRFTEAYRAYSNRGDLTTYPRKLTGDRSPDEVYQSRGLPPPKPVLIGDPARAQLVLTNGSAAGRLQITSAADAIDSAVARLIDNGRKTAAAGGDA